MTQYIRPDSDSMLYHERLADRDLFLLLRHGGVTVAGNRQQRIDGRLDCRQGRRLLRQHRVFFADEASARRAGFRPCACCLPAAYAAWRSHSTATVPATTPGDAEEGCG